MAAWVDANRKGFSYLSTAILCLVPWMQVANTAAAKVSCLPVEGPA